MSNRYNHLLIKLIPLAVVLLLSLTGTVAVARAIIYYPGIYNLGAADTYISPASYDSAYVTGGAVRVSWAALEPTEGSYNWTFLDHEIATASAKGKKISIYFGTGGKAPSWLLGDPAVHFFYYQDGTHVVQIPVPYDSIYLAKMCRFIRAFGAHYKDSTTIAYVRGSSEAITNGWGLPSRDTANRSWAGYYHFTPDTMQHAMQRVLDTFMAAFPYTPEWVEVGKVPFDSIGHNNIWQGEQIAQYGFTKYPDRMNVWREDFNACFPVPPDTFASPNPYRNSYWHILYEHPCHNGAQAVWNVRDVSCTTVPRMDQCDPTQCSKDTVMWRAVSRTFRYGMSYLEIYASDILDLSLNNTFRRTADSLAAIGKRCFGTGLSVAGSPASSGFDWSFYPNPAADELHVSLNDAGNDMVDIELRNMAGQLAKSVSFPAVAGRQMQTVNISDCPPGIWLLTLKKNGLPCEQRRLAIVR